MIDFIFRYPYRIVGAWVWLCLASIGFAGWAVSLAITAFAGFLTCLLVAKSRGVAANKIKLLSIAFAFGLVVLSSAVITFKSVSAVAAAHGSFKRVELSGYILDQPRLSLDQRDWLATLKVDEIDSIPISGLGLSLRGLPTADLRVNKDLAVDLMQGDRVSVSGILATRSDSVEEQRTRFSIRAETLSSQHHPFGSWLSKSREGFARLARADLPSGAPLVLGLSTGDTSLISRETLDRMKSVGLTHLVAVSGANCAIVMAAVLLPLSLTRARRWARVSLGLSALTLYVLLVGAEPSVLRAAVMLAFVFVSNAIGRKVHPLDAISLAILTLLFLDPWLAPESGFGLSVLATVALLSIAPKITEMLRTKLPIWLSLPIALVLATQLLCLPILVSLDSRIGPAAIFANLIAAPLVAPITVLGMLAFVFSIFSEPLAGALFSVASALATPLIGVSDTFSKPELTGITWPQGIWGLFLAITLSVSITVWLLTNRIRLRKFMVFITTAVVACIAATLLGQNPVLLGRVLPNWSVFACDVGQGDAFVLRSSDQIAVIDVGPDPDKIDSCLTQLQITRIDLLVLTHFDIDHVGGLDGVLKNRFLETAITTSFVDSRPAARATEARLESEATRVIKPRAGDRGVFGTGSYLILNPGNPSEFYEDSNDASVSMLFWFDGVQILMLADLGESGQMRATPLLLDAFQKQTCSILKVAHHGSANFYQELYQELDFDLALISVGAGNGYGHPTSRALATLGEAGIQVARTDQHGWISSRCEQQPVEGGNRLAVTVQR